VSCITSGFQDIVGNDQAQKPEETLSILKSTSIDFPIGFDVTVIRDVFVVPDCTALIKAFEDGSGLSTTASVNELDFAVNNTAGAARFFVRLSGATVFEQAAGKGREIRERTIKRQIIFAFFVFVVKLSPSQKSKCEG
jgi:hypothetical protein